MFNVTLEELNYSITYKYGEYGWMDGIYIYMYGVIHVGKI